MCEDVRVTLMHALLVLVASIARLRAHGGPSSQLMYLVYPHPDYAGTNTFDVDWGVRDSRYEEADKYNVVRPRRIVRN